MRMQPNAIQSSRPSIKKRSVKNNLSKPASKPKAALSTHRISQLSKPLLSKQLARPKPTSLPPQKKPLSKKRPQPRPTSAPSMTPSSSSKQISPAIASRIEASKQTAPWHKCESDVEPLAHQTKRISKALSWVLRHGARAKGLRIAADGSVLLKDLTKLPQLSGMTVEEFQEICTSDPKQRFFMKLGDQQPALYSIAAYTGHTITGVIGPATAFTPPAVLVHGSYWEHMESIRSSGIDASHRAVHLMDPDQSQPKWRRGITMQVRVDTSLATQAGCVFKLAANSVWLCESTIPADAIQSFTEWA